jgi:hypothetical protein
MASPSPKKAVHILLPCIWIYCTPPFIKYSDQKNELKYCLHIWIYCTPRFRKYSDQKNDVTSRISKPLIKVINK